MDLRILTGMIVTESKLSKPAKLQLLNFIQNEATIPQIKALLMDGEIVSLDEQAEEIVNSRFEIFERTKIGTLRKTGHSVSAAGGGMNPIWLIYRSIRAAYGTCTKKCGTFELNTKRRQACMDKCKLEMKQKKIAAKQRAAGGGGDSDSDSDSDNY